MMQRFSAQQFQAGQRMRSRRGGWTLVHMIMACSLLGMFMLGAARVFMLTHGTISKSQQGLTAIHQSQSMVGYLRTDVWAATEMKSLDDQTLELTMPDASVVKWRFNAKTFARSVAAGDAAADADVINADADTDAKKSVDVSGSRQWSIEVARADFVVEGPSLVLKLFDANDKPAGELRLTSQVLLANAIQPLAANEKGGTP